ncbi:unnamed protein product [Rangifer tarandus platyrhynchus]|uniref:Uncharacterized protein n=1 Tax=Rangifer tarandus platyrhynchus TaxID=3082113 RepID=A0AC59YNN0_RANTA
MTHSNQQRAWALKPLPQLSPKPPRNTHTLIQISTKPKRFPTVNSANSPKLHREGPARTTTKLLTVASSVRPCPDPEPLLGWEKSCGLCFLSEDLVTI